MSEPTSMGLSGDRRVHAQCGHLEVVRYDRAGKWYIEAIDLEGGATERVAVGVRKAAQAARDITKGGGTVFFGQRGGRTFDRIVRGEY